MKNIESYFADCDSRYNASLGMLGQVFTSPGYHTRLASGAWVHPTVHSLEYAVLLLRHGPTELHSRAETILDRVLPLQDADPVSPYFGIWPYVFEEPISQMSPPDGNWAIFCGGRVAEALVAGKGILPEALMERMKTALRNSGMFSFRSNILPGYTNISVMGGGVAAMAGELAGMPQLLEYGRRRLEAVVQSIEGNGTLCEYNSLPYNLITIHECERVLFLLKDEQTRRHAETIRAAAWRMLADLFHPGLQMFSGPQARAYADFPDPITVEKLSERLGFQLTCKTTDEHTLWTGPIDLTLVPLPCPEESRERFRKLPATPHQHKALFIRRSPELTTAGTSWFSEGSTLGSVTRENFFYQRRPVFGSWKTDEDPAVVLKLQFLCNGRPFSSAYSINAQEQNHVLSAVALIKNLGYHTPHMDIPEDGIFKIRSLRFRYVLEGKGVHAQALDSGRFALSAGDWKAVIDPVSARIGEYQGRWEHANEEGRAMVDAVIYEGEEIELPIRKTGDVEIAAGLSLLPVDAALPSTTPLVASRDGAQTSFRWNLPACSLKLDVSRHAIKYHWATGLEHR